MTKSEFILESIISMSANPAFTGGDEHRRLYTDEVVKSACRLAEEAEKSDENIFEDKYEWILSRRID